MVKDLSLNEINRIYFTAFFYSEYVLRKMVQEFQGMSEAVASWKREIANAVTVNYGQSKCFDPSDLLDGLIEYEAFKHSKKYNCDVFAGALHQRFQRRAQAGDLHEIFYMLENIQDNNEYFYEAIESLVEFSLYYGVYASHIDNFNKYEYEISKIIHVDKTYLLKHIFFKRADRIGINCEFVDFDEYIYLGEDIGHYAPKKDRENLTEQQIKEIERDEFIERSLKIYIDVTHNEYSLDAAMNCVNRALIAVKFNDICDMIENYASCKDFINLYFEKELLRANERTVLNKIFGLLMFDEKLNGNTTYKELMFIVNEKYKFTIKQKCKDKMCSKNCEGVDDCLRMAQNLLKVASQSINQGRIITSKD